MKDPRKEEERRRERQEEQNRDKRQLDQYNPWGKPGGGAPRDSTRTRGFSDDNTPWVDSRRLDTPEDTMYTQFGKPGAGAPMRTHSGKVRTGYRADSSIRFQVNGQSNNLIDKEERYRRGGADKQEYSQELQQQMAFKVMSDKEAKTQELRKEMDMMQYDPYGRPGGGAPNTNRSRNSGRFPPINNSNNNNNNGYHDNQNTRNNSSKSLTNRMKREETFEFFDPWGQGVGKRPTQNKDENKYEKHKDNNRSNKENRREKWSDRGRNTMPDIARDESPMSIKSGSLTGERPARERQHDKSEDDRPRRPFQNGPDEGHGSYTGGRGGGRNATKQVVRKRGDDFHGDGVNLSFDLEQPSGQSSRNKRHFDEPDTSKPYDPFGKGGSGAPLRDQNGRLKASYGRVTDRTSADVRRRAQAQKYREEIQQEIQEQTRKRKERDSLLKHGGGNLMMPGLAPRQQNQNAFSPANEDQNSEQRMRGNDRRSPEIKRGRDDKPRGTDNDNPFSLNIEKAANDRRKERRQNYNPADSLQNRRGMGSASSGGSFNLPGLDQSRGRDSRDAHHSRGRDSGDAHHSRGRDSREPPPAPRGPRKYSPPRREHNHYDTDGPTKAHAGRTPRASHANNYEVPMTPEIQQGQKYSLRQPWAGSIDI